jgi:hypothetical protein
LTISPVMDPSQAPHGRPRNMPPSQLRSWRGPPKQRPFEPPTLERRDPLRPPLAERRADRPPSRASSSRGGARPLPDTADLRSERPRKSREGTACSRRRDRIERRRSGPPEPRSRS